MEGIHILCTLVHSHEACAFRILVKALHFYDYHQDDVIFILWDQQFHSNLSTVSIIQMKIYFKKNF